MQRGILASLAGVVMVATVAVGPGLAPAAAPPATTYRVDAGGPKVAGTPPWSADTSTSPSPLVTASGGAGKRLATTTAIVMRNPSLPAGTPVALFRSARSANRLTWRFPVPPGAYEVRLSFAEIDPNRQASDARMFDVSVDGRLVLDDFDIFAATGGYTASMRSFVTDATSGVTVDMQAVTGPPLVSAVEVLPYVPPTVGQDGSWTLLPNSHYRRSEQTFVYSSATGRFYLVGGIGKVEGVQVRRIEEYDPATARWTTVGTLPTNINHVQAVELNGLIYYLAGWVAPYATYVFDPVTRHVSVRARMPRPRGAGGVAVHEGRIYYAGGLDPYRKESTPWFSVYDPATDTWSELPDMPRARDHFGAAIVDGKLYAIGGRHVVREIPVVENDAYDLTTGVWQTGLAPLPTERSGTATALLGDEILVLGGERFWNQPPRKTVEAYHPATDTWRALPDMAVGAHGIQAVVCNGSVYVAAGATSAGAKDPSTFFQVYFPGEATPCPELPPVEPPPAAASLPPLARDRSATAATANAEYCVL
jgi:hypothetical protein